MTSTAPTELRKQSDELSSDSSALTACRGPIVIGHRGASESYPENTLISFEKALETGAHAFEFDVRCSRDGVPIVIHDATVDRTTDGSGKVADMNLVEIGELNAGGGEKIPTLVEVLDAFRSTPVLIDIKVVDVSRPVLQVLTDLDALHRVVVGSFEHSALRVFREARVRTTASRREIVWWWSKARIGWSPRLMAYESFSVPEWSGRVHVVDRRFVSSATKRGVPVHVWTVDDEADAARLWSMGVTGLITNRPAALVAVLKRMDEAITETSYDG